MQRLRPREVRQAIEDYLELVGERGNVPADLDVLARVLDRLALAGSVESPGDRVESMIDLEPERAKYDVLRARIAPRFPQLGLYRSASLDPEEELLVGDAIDDLVDIALELGEVAWLWEHAGKADALSHLRFTFRIHWGEHLRGLQWVLHMQRSEST